MNASFLIYFGAADWVNPAWRNGFYPADLPEDWLLSYYNTQFRAVYLPETTWERASAETWTQWLDETQPGFHFVLEASDATVSKPASERVVLATPAWATAHIWWLDDTPDLRALARRIEHHATAGAPLYVFSRDGNLALLEQIATLADVMGY